MAELTGAAGFWYGCVNEGGSYTVLARVTALDGSGTEVVRGEGKCLLQADVDSITCRVFDLGEDKENKAGVALTPDPTLDPATNLLDSLLTTGWAIDNYGYNFRHDVDPSYDDEAGTDHTGEWYLLEYKFTLVGGGIIWLKVKVKTTQVQTT